MLASLTVRKIFLIDSAGALITFLLLSQVLTRMENVFGVPESTLRILATIAGCFFIYSLASAFFVRKNWKPFLLIIAIANGVYCLVTISLIFHLLNSITAFGVAYFSGEVILIVMLVIIEVKYSLGRIG